MRKKTISYGLDQIMWYIVYLLPILIFLMALIVTPIADVDNWLKNSSAFNAIEQTWLFDSLNDIFGADGMLPMFTGSTNVYMLYYACYFVYVMILHLFVDFLVFIPRLCHKWFNSLFQKGD